MLPVGPVGSVPLEKCGLGPDPVGRGMPLLRRVPGRDSHTPEWKAGHRQRNLRKAAQAIGRFCRKTDAHKQDAHKQDASPKDTSFSAKLEELRKVFLTRPDCPRFSTRATSVCQCGSAISDKLPEELHAALASWEVSRDPFSSQRVDGCPLPLSKSACEFSSLWRKSDSGPVSPALSSPVLARSPLRKRVPWYVSIIHEKDHRLLTLGEEVQRLSRLELLLRERDEEVLALQEEREALRKQLKCLCQSKGPEILMKAGSSGILKDGGPPEGGVQGLDMGPTGVVAQMSQPQEECPAVHRVQDPEVVGGEEEEAGKAEGQTGKGEAAPKEGGEEEEKQLEEEEEEVPEEEDVLEDEAERRTSSRSLEEAFEEELIAQLEECELVIQELQAELEATRTRYSLSTGAIVSLQRQVDFQESQLQQMRAQNETLQRTLRERMDQLQAMSDKFSNLREDKKHEEMMGLIEKDNFLLRQQVEELQGTLAKQEHAVSELEAKVRQLQEQASQREDRLQRQKLLQEEMGNRSELAQEAELQARVALESTQSRLEGLRNKIIQATFSASGVQSSAAEISDNDILEALQRLISERVDYYNQLKQKGVRMPPLNQLEASSSLSKTKKTTPK